MPDLTALLTRWIRHAFGPLADQEQREERRRQQRRRRAAYLATWGIDIGPRLIHGVVIAR